MSADDKTKLTEMPKNMFLTDAEGECVDTCARQYI